MFRSGHWQTKLLGQHISSLSIPSFLTVSSGDIWLLVLLSWPVTWTLRLALALNIAVKHSLVCWRVLYRSRTVALIWHEVTGSHGGLFKVVIFAQFHARCLQLTAWDKLPQLLDKPMCLCLRPGYLRPGGWPAQCLSHLSHYHEVS